MAIYWDENQLYGDRWKQVEVPIDNSEEKGNFHIKHASSFFKVMGDTLYVRGTALIWGNYGNYSPVNYVLGKVPSELSGNWSISPSKVDVGTVNYTDQHYSVTANYKITNGVLTVDTQVYGGFQNYFLLGFNLQFTRL